MTGGLLAHWPVHKSHRRTNKSLDPERATLELSEAMNGFIRLDMRDKPR